eukprot:NODE_8772_length_1471_cov_4.813244.p1 GENE.NODE_8772_length_1471_cov_4.813244~~NODE_8772_length_1471_cov_4.813244.p1  ORF type:complete len:409 (+),score=104.36 NODE_8772_length_1471_cov_4.813244:1-1227(+)
MAAGMREGLDERISTCQIVGDLDAALAALESRDWPSCNMAAASARFAAWRSLDAEGRWSRPCVRELFVLVELLLALCFHLEGDVAAAVMHADYALMFSVPSKYHRQASECGRARSAALLFMTWLDAAAAALRPPPLEPVASARFPPPPPAEDCPSMPFDTSVVPRVAAPRDAGELHERLLQRRPFVVASGLEAWPARANWSALAHLDATAGHHLVPVQLPGGARDARRDDEWCAEVMPLADFLRDHLAPSCTPKPPARPWFEDEDKESEGAHLAWGTELLEHSPALRSDVPGPPALWREALCAPSRISVWLAARGASSWRRTEATHHVCFAQLHGAARAMLLEPDVAAGIVEPAACGISAPDFKGLPKSICTQLLVADLVPGDVLYVPVRWMHQVRALSACCAVHVMF